MYQVKHCVYGDEKLDADVDTNAKVTCERTFGPFTLSEGEKFLSCLFEIFNLLRLIFNRFRFRALSVWTGPYHGYGQNDIRRLQTKESYFISCYH